MDFEMKIWNQLRYDENTGSGFVSEGAFQLAFYFQCSFEDISLDTWNEMELQILFLWIMLWAWVEVPGK